MELVRGVTFRKQPVVLDDKSFVGCTFVECEVRYSGGPVAFDRSVFRRCRYVFYGPARSTVEFLQHAGILPFLESQWIEFPDGAH